jgi:hypothetical protein
MAKTPAQLAESVLREIGVIDAVEAPSAEDSDYVVAVYASKFAELAAPGLEFVYWSLAEIPEAVFLTLRDLVINEVSGAFGSPIAPADKDAQETIILRRLRRHVAIKPTGLATEAVYF